MFQKINKIIELLKRPSITKMFCLMRIQGYLKDIGWVDSFINKMPVDSKNKPLPWVTYSYIDFIEGRINKMMSVFEYGSGNSTLWYAEKVKSIVSIEHDRQWYEKMIKIIPKNASLYYKELVYDGQYSRFPQSMNLQFEIIIIDGRDRVNSIKEGSKVLSGNGVIIVDDSERVQYREGMEFLKEKGFKRIDFWGLSPGVFFKKCTTIFYKENNVLGI